MKLKTKITLVMSAIVLLATVVFAILVYTTQKRALFNGIYSKLYTTARFAKETLPADYHARIRGADSVSPKEYTAIVDKWNRLCVQLDLEYIWSLMVFEGRTVFTSGSSTSKDVRKGDYAHFFETHSNPELYEKAFATMRPVRQVNDDKWGRIIVVLLPFKDASGRPYLFGASMKTAKVDALTRETMWRSLEISGVVFALGVIFSALLANSLTRPIETLTDVARNISRGDLDQTIDVGGSSEIRSLSRSIGRMSLAIREKLSELQSGNDILQEEIAERKHAEEMLRESEERLEMAQRVAGIGSWDWHIEEDNLYWSTETFRELGLECGEIVPSYEMFETFVHPDDRESFKRDFDLALKGEKPYSREVRMLRKDGGEWIMYTQGMVERNEEGKPVRFVGTQQNITERKKAERERQDLEEQAQYAQRLVLCGRIAAGVAHEINNPLASVKSSFMLVKDAIASDHPYFHYVERIECAIDRMALIIQQMYQLHSPESYKPVFEDVESIVEEVFLMFQSKIEAKNLKFEMNVPASIPPILAPKGQIFQVVGNLVLNAIGASSPESEKIIVSIKRDEEKGDFLNLEIKDFGHGISPDVLPMIFDPFFTTKDGEGEEGIGLGLSVSINLTRAMGGDIRVKSEEGKGSAFTLILPCRSET